VAVVAAFVLSAGAASAQATTWSVDNPTISEGTGGSSQVSFTVTGSDLPGLFGSSSIDYATANGSAIAGSDYTGTSGTVTLSGGLLAGGSASTQVTVDVNPDATPEPDETFRLVLTDGTSGTATILNDDAPHLSVSDPSVSEHDGSAVFTISLDGAAKVSVNYATTDGSAVAGQDYQPAAGKLTFQRGEFSKQIAVPIINDSTYESTENFNLDLSGTTGIASTGDKLIGTATIADDDPAPAPPPTSTSTSPSSPAGSSGLGGSSLTGSSFADTTNPQPTLTKPRSSRGTILVAISCPATELLCRGTLTTFAEPDRHSRVSWLHSERKLGSATFVIAGGKQALITTRLSKSALRRLRRAGRVSIRSYAVVRDAAGNIGTASVGARLARVR
jgi:Calx-beta domain